MKIKNIREKIKAEQSVKENDGQEFRRLSLSKDKNKISRIRHVFEKKNRTSTDRIEKLQRRLLDYESKVTQYGEDPLEKKSCKQLQRFSSESNILQTRGIWSDEKGESSRSMVMNRMYNTQQQLHGRYQQQTSSNLSEYEADRSATSESGIGVNNSGNCNEKRKYKTTNLFIKNSANSNFRLKVIFLT